MIFKKTEIDSMNTLDIVSDSDVNTSRQNIINNSCFSLSNPDISFLKNRIRSQLTGNNKQDIIITVNNTIEYILDVSRNERWRTTQLDT